MRRRPFCVDGLYLYVVGKQQLAVQQDEQRAVRRTPRCVRPATTKCDHDMLASPRLTIDGEIFSMITTSEISATYSTCLCGCGAWGTDLKNKAHAKQRFLRLTQGTTFYQQSLQCDLLDIPKY